MCGTAMSVGPTRADRGGMRRGSFTDRVVAELAPHVPQLAHCRTALLEGMALTARVDDGAIATPRLVAARCAVAALHADGRPAHAVRRTAARRAVFVVAIPSGGTPSSSGTCCSRHRVRGALLALGTVSRPERPPQLELPVRDVEAGAVLLRDLRTLEVDAGLRTRRGRVLVTVRTASGVGAVLSSVGAQGGRLAFEEGRVMRDVRGAVNRAVCGESANLRRTVDAAVLQLDAVRRLAHEPARWDALPPGVRAAAALRRAHPHASLDELAVAAGISRPAMAGRLHRLLAIADG